MKQPIRIDKLTPNQGLLDFSHLLEAPAGCHGFIRAKDGHLFFEDGKRARFIGFNIAARSNTPDHETAARLAERFASMGVNVIRLHAADAPIGDEPCSWSSCRKAPLLDYEKGSSRLFHPEGLDRFDYLIAKLKEKGIYLHIDLIVARAFLEADGLSYPGEVPSCTKRYPMYNARLIELQKEYARELLCHINPYTGLSLKDDPAVMCVQINNEESAIKGTDSSDNMKDYRDEVCRKFNDFLLEKYKNREGVEKAWTFEGTSALSPEEDPSKGNIRGIEGSFYQTVCEPMGEWNAPEGPARYADFMDFGIQVNRNFYEDMKGYLRSLGVKVPIVTSNLTAGAADVYGHAGGDIMENNAYFNHPILPVIQNTYMTAGPTEYVSTDPLSIQRGIGALGTTILSLASVAIVQGKPFMLSEWNEYGLHPFHSTAFVQTVAYACLNDWDGLILYNYHTSENPDDQPDDEICNVFDAYNDPALISQWGFMASVFLNGSISPAKRKIDVVYTKQDVLALPNFHAMPMCFFPYVGGMRNVFLEEGETYEGSADVAVSAGFFAGSDLSKAAHRIEYAWSPYKDPFRKELAIQKEADPASRPVGEGVWLSPESLKFDQISNIAGFGDYHAFAVLADTAMKEWGLWQDGTGFTDGKLVSDTKEICFDPGNSRFQVRTDRCAYFSGAPEERISLSEKIEVKSKNDRISLALIPVGEGKIDDSHKLLLTAVGTTGTDQESVSPGPEYMPGICLSMVRKDGKLYAETLEGSIIVRSGKATMTMLDPVGKEIGTIQGKETAEGTEFILNSRQTGIQYVLKL